MYKTHSKASIALHLSIPCGGDAGKSLASTNFILNSPPSYGVPATTRAVLRGLLKIYTNQE